MRTLILFVVLISFYSCGFAAEPQPTDHKPITFLAWNLESGGSDPAVIAAQLVKLHGYDVYALSEVAPNAFEKYKLACGDGFESIDGATGRSDRLQVIFNSARFELVRKLEMDRFEDHVLNSGNQRSPLMMHLRERDTKRDFLVVVNHLVRGNETVHNEQDAGLREWARAQTLPCITIGDFNMDYDFHAMKGNQAFIEILRDGIWSWVKPAELIDTNWYDPEHDGKDNFYDSMLDFAFVAGPAKDWKPACKVIVRGGDFPDDKTTSDHRPIELRVKP
jgi:endonuclease/exonuclease/phosphatase family metal-dependent hydrolase